MTKVELLNKTTEKDKSGSYAFDDVNRSFYTEGLFGKVNIISPDPSKHKKVSGPAMQMNSASEGNDLIQMTPNLAEPLQMISTNNSPTLQRLPQNSNHSAPSLSGPQVQVAQSLSMPPEQFGTITRSNFDSMMQSNFGVSRVYDGSRGDQENILRSASGNASLTFNPPAYSVWNPGADSVIYAQIVNAFRSFSQTFGGIPPVTEIGFFGLRYAYDRSTSSVVPEANVPAAYGGNKLLIYSLIAASAKRLPTGRSTTGSSPRPMPTRDETMSRIITHELGHGLVEIGLTPQGSASSGGTAPDAQLINDYKRAVGWSSGTNPRLYDIGVPAVSQAIAAGTTPEARFQITRANWNQPTWVEQPISGYMTTHPSEDFPEAVMAYINASSLLQSRSPARFRFIQQRAIRLGPYLRHIAAAPPQPGDYPIVQGNQAMG